MGDGAIYTIHSEPDRKSEDEIPIAESEARYRAIFEQAAVGISRISLDGQWIEVNDKFCEITGYEREELLGMHYQDISHTDDLAENQNSMRRLIDGDEKYRTFQKRYHRKDGRNTWVNITSTLVRDDRNFPWYFVSVIEDISLRKKMEAELCRDVQINASLQELSSMVLQAPPIEEISATVLDNVIRYTESTDGCIGYRVSLTGAFVYPAYSDSRFLDRIRAAQADKKPEEFVTDTDPDARCMVIPLTIGTAVVGQIAIGNEIRAYLSEDLAVTQRFGDLYALAVNRHFIESHIRRLSETVNQSPASIIITDPDGRIEYVNPSFEKITGYTADEVAGRNPRFLKSGDKSHEEYRELWSTILSGKVWKGEFLNHRKDGTIFWESASISPILDANGMIIHFVAVKEDITEKKRLEDQLRREQNILVSRTQELTLAYKNLKIAQSQMVQQEKMASIGQLAAGVAHEINNPMGFIMSNLNSLKKYIPRFIEYISLQESILDTGNPADSEFRQRREHLREKRKALKIDYLADDVGQLIGESLDGAERVKKIVQDLKSFSHTNNTEMKLSDLNAGIESALNIVWNELKYRVKIVRDFADIPPLYCSIGQLGQVFMNLLVNAAQAIPSEGEITIRTWADKTHAHVSISDTGCGIEPDRINRIFEPFYTTKEVGRGTGLGLSIAYDIVKKHHGDIFVESSTGKGTTFTLLLPLREG